MQNIVLLPFFSFLLAGEQDSKKIQQKKTYVEKICMTQLRFARISTEPFFFFFCWSFSRKIVLCDIMRISSDAFRALSHQYINIHWPDCNVSHVTDVIFKSYFWLSPQLAAELWNNVRHTDITLRPVHLLWALYYMKIYNTYNHSSRFFGVGRSTYIEKVHLVVKVLKLYSYDIVSVLYLLIISMKFFCT